jgi:hypothetical protein
VSRAANVTLSSHGAYIGCARRPRWLSVADGLELAQLADRPHEFDAAVNRLAQADAPPAYESDPTLPIPGAKRITSKQIVNAVIDAFGLPSRALHRRHARGEESDAKRVAFHVARACQTPLAEIAAELGVSRQRASLVASLEPTLE